MAAATNVTISHGLDGYYAAPPQAAGVPGIVVLMEAFGLTAHIRGVCDRLAAAGFAALAPDIFHGKIFDYARLDDAIGAIRALDDGRTMDEVAASLDFLAQHPGVAPLRLGVTGFCMGGRLAFLAGCRHASRLRAAVCFYGGGIAPEGDTDRLGRSPPIKAAAELESPLLLIYGAKDSSITAAEQGRVAQRLTELDKRYVLSVYPGAGHGFCCEHRSAYVRDAAEAAHAEAIGFFRKAFAA